jgi:arsenate reductase-like glutaredoxin family protein
VDFTKYVKTKPDDPNISKIPEQMTEKWRSFYLMRSRGEYLVEYDGVLQQDGKSSKERRLAEVRKAESMLRGLGIGDVNC